MLPSIARSVHLTGRRDGQPPRAVRQRPSAKGNVDGRARQLGAALIERCAPSRRRSRCLRQGFGSIAPRRAHRTQARRVRRGGLRRGPGPQAGAWAADRCWSTTSPVELIWSPRSTSPGDRPGDRGLAGRALSRRSGLTLDPAVIGDMLLQLGGEPASWRRRRAADRGHGGQSGQSAPAGRGDADGSARSTRRARHRRLGPAPRARDPLPACCCDDQGPRLAQSPGPTAACARSTGHRLIISTSTSRSASRQWPPRRG